MKYTNTRMVIGQSFDGLKPGQWVMFDSGIRGQFMGKTAAGVIVLRYQSGKFGERKDTTSNKLLREYAKINGAK